MSKKNSQIILIAFIIGTAILDFFLWRNYKNISSANLIVQAPTQIAEEKQTTTNQQFKNQTTENNNLEPASSEPTAKKQVQAETEKINQPLQIINKFVQWGYRIPETPRIIDTIIVHSSYNALGGYIYDVSKIIKEYKMYGVSPHYIISREGTIYRLVPEKYIAYHAGRSKTPDGRTDVNSFSIGIEVVNSKTTAPTEKQYYSLAQLIKLIKTRYKIKYILGHNQIAPDIKTDPWNFNWQKLNSLIEN